MNKECLGPRGPKIDLRESEKVRQGSSHLEPWSSGGCRICVHLRLARIKLKRLEGVGVRGTEETGRKRLHIFTHVNTSLLM